MTKGLHKNSLRKGDNPHQWMIDDAKMALIQQIRAEIERRISECDARSKVAAGMNLHNTMEANDVVAGQFRSFLSFLDTLQEQPVKVGDKVSIIKRKEGIVTRISDGKARVETGDTMEIVSLSELVAEQPVCEDDKIRKELIIHLEQEAASATLNVNRKRWKDMIAYVKGLNIAPVCEELDEAAKDYTDSSEWSVGENLEHIDNAFKAGANWQKEQMMKEFENWLRGNLHHLSCWNVDEFCINLQNHFRP